MVSTKQSIRRESLHLRDSLHGGASYNGSTTVSKTVSVGSIPPAPATKNSAERLDFLYDNIPYMADPTFEEPEPSEAIAKRRKEMIDRVNERSLPEFLTKDGMYEISDADFTKYFCESTPPVVLQFSKEGSGGDFKERLNGELVTRATTFPSWKGDGFGFILMKLQDIRGKKIQRLVRQNGAYLLASKENGLRLDDAGRSTDVIRFVQLDRLTPKFEHELPLSITTILKDFFARYTSKQCSDGLVDAEIVRNEFFIHDRTANISETEREGIQQNADEMEKDILAFREASGGDDVAGIFDVQRIGNRGSWLHVQIDGGAKHDESFGRLFINVPPEKMHAVFKALTYALLPVCMEQGIPLDLKTIIRCSTIEVERIEKIVIYFNDIGISHICEALEKVAIDHPELLQTNTHMPFTIPLKIHEQTFPSVTFAQQPNNGASWAESRATLLVETAKIIRKGEKTADAFAKACQQAGISEIQPAFEIDGEKHFPNIVKYLAGF